MLTKPRTTAVIVSCDRWCPLWMGGACWLRAIEPASARRLRRTTDASSVERERESVGTVKRVGVDCVAA